ncbi:MAG: AI-2E family transporter [Candidatus Nanopelagicales bacterium]|jgi:putative heme transporter|nr:AI-2E family transporter [Candidatus Nanopelagicales bacterium]
MSANQPAPPSDGVPRPLKVLSANTWRLLVVVAGLFAIGYVLNILFAVAFALFFALLVTAWAGPVMRFFEKKLPKVISMILALVLIAAAIVGILSVVVASVVGEGPKLVASIKSGLSEITEWVRKPPLSLSDDQFSTLVTDAQNAGTSVAKGVAGEALAAFGSLSTVVIAGSVFLFAVIFFLLAPNQIWNWLLSWIPSKGRHHIDVSGHIFWDSIAGYTRGVIIVALADASLVFIGLMILQVPLAPALAAVVFFGAFIPVIGAPVATFFAAVVALAENGPVTALLVILLTIIVGSFDGDVMQPLVMGKAVNLHPLAIVIAIAVGAISLGIVGALIAVPITGAVYGVMKYVSNRDPEHPYNSPPPTSAAPPTAAATTSPTSS